MQVACHSRLKIANDWVYLIHKRRATIIIAVSVFSLWSDDLRDDLNRERFRYFASIIPRKLLVISPTWGLSSFFYYFHCLKSPLSSPTFPRVVRRSSLWSERNIPGWFAKIVLHCRRALDTAWNHGKVESTSLEILWKDALRERRRSADIVISESIQTQYFKIKIQRKIREKIIVLQLLCCIKYLVSQIAIYPIDSSFIVAFFIQGDHWKLDEIK